MTYQYSVEQATQLSPRKKSKLEGGKQKSTWPELVTCNICGYAPNVKHKYQVFGHRHGGTPVIFSCTICGEHEIGAELVDNHVALHKTDDMASGSLL